MPSSVALTVDGAAGNVSLDSGPAKADIKTTGRGGERYRTYPRFLHGSDHGVQGGSPLRRGQT